MVAWHEVPGIAADCDPSRRDGMIECYTNDANVCDGFQNAKLALAADNRYLESNLTQYGGAVAATS
jgi:hypothetical protein